MRAKYKNQNELIYPRMDYIDIGNNRISPPTDEALALAGWKNVVYTTQPVCPSGKHAESYWVDGESITQAWNIVDDTPEMICAQLRYWFDNYYRKYNEMLMRYTALGIQETVVDEIRGKTYTTLNDLYTEAEIVRARINELENTAVSS